MERFHMEAGGRREKLMKRKVLAFLLTGAILAQSMMTGQSVLADELSSGGMEAVDMIEESTQTEGQEILTEDSQESESEQVDFSQQEEELGEESADNFADSSDFVEDIDIIEEGSDHFEEEEESEISTEAVWEDTAAPIDTAAAFSLLPGDGKRAIPADAALYEGHYYKIYGDTGSTWSSAEEYCESIGGHLATVRSKEEKEFVTGLFGSTALNGYWIGMYRNTISSAWEWVTGETVDYTNWAANEPNNDMDMGECYVHMFGVMYTGGKGIKYPGDWNDVTDSGASYENSFYSIAKFGFVCEWEPEVIRIRLEEGAKGVAKQEIPISAEVVSETFVPDGTNLFWNIQETEDAEFGKVAVSASGENSYTVSTTVKIPRPGKYTIEVSTEEGAGDAGFVLVVPEKVTNLKGNNPLSAEAGTGEAFGSLHREIEVSWDLSEGVDGYLVDYSRDSAFEKYDQGYSAGETTGESGTEFTSERMERGSKYYVRVCAYKRVDGELLQGEYSDVLKVTIGNQILPDEMLGIQNSEVWITSEDYEKVFGKSLIGDYIFLKEAGGGYNQVLKYLGGFYKAVCYGMVMTGLASYDHDTAPIEEYGTRFFDVKSFDQAKGIRPSSLGGISLFDSIKYAYISQGDSAISDCSTKNFSKFQTLFDLIKACQEGKGTPVTISIKEEFAGHRLLAVGIVSVEADQAQIAVYDPNCPGQEKILTLQLVYPYRWSLPWGSSGEGSGDIEGFSQGDALGSRLVAERLRGVSQGKDYSFKYAGEFLAGVYAAGKEIVDFREKAIAYLEEHFGADKPIVEESEEKSSDISALYWHNSDILRLPDVPAKMQVLLTSTYHSVMAEAEQDSDIELHVGLDQKVGSVTLTPSEDTSFEVVFHDLQEEGEYGTRKTIRGTAKAGKTVTIEQTEEGNIRVTGVEHLTYEKEEGYRESDGSLRDSKGGEISQDLNVSNTYEVKDDGKNITVSADKDGDGTFEDVLNTSQICSHRYMTVIDKEATCTEEGRQHEECSICHKVKPGSETAIPMKEHVAVIDPAVPPTGTSTGLTEGSHCRVCGQVLTAQQTVPALSGGSSTGLSGKEGSAGSQIKVKKTKIKKLKSVARRTVLVKWKKIKSVNGYQIQCARNKKFTKGKKTKKVSGYKKTSIRLRKLKSGKRYYVRVRTYKKLNGKTYYSAWSKVKKIRVR